MPLSSCVIRGTGACQEPASINPQSLQAPLTSGAVVPQAGQDEFRTVHRKADEMGLSGMLDEVLDEPDEIDV